MQRTNRFIAVLGPVIISVMAFGTVPALAVTQPGALTEAGWQQAITHLPALSSGCYHASFPSLQWSSTQCTTAPSWALAPAAPSHGTGPATAVNVGAGNDYSAEVAGTISQATGSFPYVSGGITEQGQVGGTGGLVDNTFTLQLDSQFFTDPPACSGSSDPGKCQGWQQFVYETHSDTVYMQYWLLNYGATCPSGWSTDSKGCYANSPASTFPGTITAAGLASTALAGSASLGGTDEVSLASGGQATMAAHGDGVLDLAQYWDTTEFGIFGDGNASAADFGPDTTLATATSLDSSSLSAPTCVQEGFTAETNNLSLAHTPGFHTQVSPTMASVQSNASSRTASCSVAAGAGPLTGATSVTGSYCALVSSGGVDCWGDVPFQVKGVGGTGILTGVTSLVSGYNSHCAVLGSGGVDCWGDGQYGQLGNGQVYTRGKGSAFPVQVEGVGGTGTLTGVISLSSDAEGYCALLASGGVDCWGGGHSGQLGNGQFYPGGNAGSAVPVQVEGVGGTGTLTGVASLTKDNDLGFCALLASGGVDCWGYGQYGQLGNGQFYTTGNEGSAVPVQVEGVGGSGTLAGVTSLTVEDDEMCALLASSGVDCWGSGGAGDLGDGQFYPASPYGSAVPVQVVGVGGTGTLTGVAALSGYCALLASGTVDCWGVDDDGQLGNGQFYTTGNEGSAVPVQVEGVGGTGTLTGVTGITTDDQGYCALLASSGADCWGGGFNGELGNGQFYPFVGISAGSAVPVQVVGVSGLGTLTGVSSMATDGNGYCALLASSGVDCWGQGGLGNGRSYPAPYYGSAVPVQVEGVIG